jgi:hypothetical protein
MTKRAEHRPPKIGYFIQSRGPGNLIAFEKVYVYGPTRRDDEGIVGYDLQVRPTRLGPGSYTFVASPHDVEWTKPGESKPPKKSHAQIKREVNEILAENPRGGLTVKATIPGFTAWNRSSGGTSAAPGKYGYSFIVPEGEYHVWPVSARGRHRGYSLMFAARQQPHGGHGGLWHDLGMHQSPAKATAAARKHYAGAY